MTPFSSKERVPLERWLAALLLLIALALRLPGLAEPWSGKGFNSAIGAFGTAEFVENFEQYGYFESGGMPYRWRVELADGTIEREWYAHHPGAFVWLSAVSRACLPSIRPELAVRLPWLVLSMLLPWAVWRSFRRLFGPRVALGGLVAAAATPLAAHYSLLPFVDNGVLAAALVAATARFTLWLEREERADLFWATVWMAAASLLDWTAAMGLPALGLAALIVAVRRRRGGLFLRALLLPGTLVLSAVLHAVHMWLVLGLDELLHDSSTTLLRTTTPRQAWGEFVLGQGRALEENLGAWTLVAMLVGLVVLAVNARRISTLRLWAVVALCLPGALYVSAFPFRGSNHHFMWMQSMGGVAVLVGFALAGLTRLRGGRWLATIGALVLLGLGGRATLELARATRSDAVALASRHPQMAPLLDDADGVLVTAMGQGWTLLPYSRAPLIPRVDEIEELEQLRERVLSRLGAGRRVSFLFDVQFRRVHEDLLTYLRASGESTQVLDGLKADPTVAFEIFDLTEWASR